MPKHTKAKRAANKRRAGVSRRKTAATKMRKHK